METVIVVDAKHPDGEFLINKSDFDASVHTIKGEGKKPRDILLDRAAELELEFAPNISNKDLKALIEAKEAEVKE